VPKILQNLPFFEVPTDLHVPGAELRILHHQIVVWVSVTGPAAASLPAHAPRFPAVLDTGFNDNFLIQEQQLQSWAGINPSDLTITDRLSVGGLSIPLREANLWIHPNQPGSRDAFSGAQPFCLELDTGIGVWPRALPGARRLPLLGLRGLRQGDLQLELDCRRCRVSLRTPSWWQRLLG